MEFFQTAGSWALWMPQRDRESWASCSRTMNKRTQIPQLGMKGTVDWLNRWFSYSLCPTDQTPLRSLLLTQLQAHCNSSAEHRIGRKYIQCKHSLGIKSCFHLFRSLKSTICTSTPILCLSWSQILQVATSKWFPEDKSSKTEGDSFLHLPNLAGCSRKRVNKGRKVNSFRTPQQVLRKQMDVYQYTRQARLGLLRTVNAGQRILRRTLKATVREVICNNGPHAYSQLTSTTDGTVI